VRVPPQAFEEGGEVAVCGVDPAGGVAAVDAHGVGDTAHERDEVGGGEVGADGPLRPRGPGRGGWRRRTRVHFFEFRGAGHGVGGRGGDGGRAASVAIAGSVAAGGAASCASTLPRSQRHV